MLDEYKYPLQKILSYEQIAAMRKTLQGASSTESKAEKKEAMSSYSYQD